MLVSTSEWVSSEQKMYHLVHRSTSLCEDIAWILDIIGVKTKISGSDLSFQ